MDQRGRKIKLGLNQKLDQKNVGNMALVANMTMALPSTQGLQRVWG